MKLGTPLTVMLLLGSCRNTAEPVRIGVAFPARNVPVAFMAADEINAAGGVRGRPVQIVRDTIPVSAEPADLEIQRALSIVARGPLVGVVGHGGSRGSLAAAPVYNDAKIVHIVPTGTSRLLARAGPWTFPLPPNDSIEGAFIAAFVRDVLRARTVVIFYVSDEYGVGLRDGVRAALAGSPVSVRREQRYDLESDLGSLLQAAVQGGAPDVVLVAGRLGSWRGTGPWCCRTSPMRPGPAARGCTWRRSGSRRRRTRPAGALRAGSCSGFGVKPLPPTR
jgi:branched-chain amino acid transport system substrate-binding protein